MMNAMKPVGYESLTGWGRGVVESKRASLRKCLFKVKIGRRVRMHLLEQVIDVR